ncbi:MAG: DUF177 domain-containing protein [Thermodesulfobacteriota bacterium]
MTEIPGGGLDVFASRGKASIPRILEGMDPAPLTVCRLIDAELQLSVESGEMLVEGSFEAEGESPCDRCSDTVPVRFGKAFQTVLMPKGEGPKGAGAVELHAEDMDVGYYDGKGIEVNDVFWEQVALEIPLKVVCSEDCKGVCPTCGANRNREECSCATRPDPGPFDVLKNLKGKKE